MSSLSRDSLRVSPKVHKTIKFFINGEFVRTESGRSLPALRAGTKEVYAQLGRASRKDLRNAVEAARGAQAGWAKKTAYNRSQILYRAAEMLDGKRAELALLLRETQGLNPTRAEAQVEAALDAFVYYAGFADKFSPLMGAVNPVAGPHHCFTTPEPLGVVGVLQADCPELAAFVARLASILCAGNAVVGVLSEAGAPWVGPLAEVFATSDFPKGVVNLISGHPAELHGPLAAHLEVDGVAWLGSDAAAEAKLRSAGVANLKRFSARGSGALGLEPILDFVEYKTVWHPVGY
jgi:acyl-CoA reductase-like NAD-dependent aldehyde dehydrogenase